MNKIPDTTQGTGIYIRMATQRLSKLLWLFTVNRFPQCLQQLHRDPPQPVTTLQLVIPAHADGGLRALVGHPRLGEVVVVAPGEHTGDQGKGRAGPKRASTHRLTVRWVLKYHRAVAGVVGGNTSSSSNAPSPGRARKPGRKEAQRDTLPPPTCLQPNSPPRAPQKSSAPVLIHGTQIPSCSLARSLRPVV